MHKHKVSVRCTAVHGLYVYCSAVAYKHPVNLMEHAANTAKEKPEGLCESPQGRQEKSKW